MPATIEPFGRPATERGREVLADYPDEATTVIAAWSGSRPTSEGLTDVDGDRASGLAPAGSSRR
jgi:hypothetical protein